MKVVLQVCLRFLQVIKRILLNVLRVIMYSSINLSYTSIKCYYLLAQEACNFIPLIPNPTIFLTVSLLRFRISWKPSSREISLDERFWNLCFSEQLIQPLSVEQPLKLNQQLDHEITWFWEIVKQKANGNGWSIDGQDGHVGHVY